MQQLAIPYQQDESYIRSYLERASGREVSLVITDNSASVLYIKPKGDSISVRLHRMFLAAGGDVLDEISDYIKHRRKKTPLIRNFINQNIHQLEKKTSRKVNLRQEGKHYNLLEMFDSINNEYFDDRISASITWGSKGPRRAARRRTLGSYSGRSKIIRINPILDNLRVPRYFVEFIVYHEMLHADIGIKTAGDRRIIHSGEFKRREKLFRHYERAIGWEKKRW